MKKVFSEIIFDINGEDTSYLTHSFHPYPAKFPPQLPKIILNNFSKPGHTVLDPFCGSGTTLVESRLFGANAIGVDVNGLSVLLSIVKSTPLNNNQISEVKSLINELQNDILYWKMNERPSISLKEIEGREHWFQNNVSEELTFLINKINCIKDENVRNFLKIVFSSIIVKVSNQDSDTRFAAIEKNIKDFYTLEHFCKKGYEYLLKVKEFSQLIDNSTVLKVYNADTRNLNFIEDKSIDIIITSPPYANTYDYYLYHKFRKRWLDIDVEYAQYNEIGSRREYSSLKKNKQKWNEDLYLCFLEMHRVLKHQSLAFIVIGDSVIQKELIKIEKEISNIAIKIGFKVLEIISSDLSTHSKIFNPTFAQKGKKEHLIILEKK